MLKILHVFFATSKVSSGVFNQLLFEANATKKLKNCTWDTCYWIPGHYSKPYIKDVRDDFFSIIINNIKFYFWLNKASRHYDYIIIRYPTYDPFVFLLNLKCKHLTIHHTKESNEHKYYRYSVIKKLVEKFISRKLIKKSCGVIGVTSEIAATAAIKSEKNLTTYILPNGIDYDIVKVSREINIVQNGLINLLFIASSISSWHGLDRIIQGVLDDPRLKLFVIGEYSSEDNYLKNERIVFLGYKDKDEINDIAKQCHIALGCFAFDRINLSEAVTLKVREYLAMGIPVYSGAKDAVIPNDFPYYSYTLHKFDAQLLFNFYSTVKDVSRIEVRNTSEQYISKYRVMKKFITDL